MKQQKEMRSEDGMTLVEVIVAMLIFVIAATGVTASLIQTQRMSYNAVYENAAFNAAQGFMEQMRSMTYADFENVYADPNNQALPTLSTTSSGSSIIIDDVLNFHVDSNGVYDPNSYDSKSVVVDANIVNDVEVEITMAMKFRLKLRDLSTDVESGQTPWTAFEVRLGYEYEVPTPGGSKWMTGDMVTVISKHEI